MQSQGCLGATEAEFATWLMQEPPLLMWISTLNRMKSAEHSTIDLFLSLRYVLPRSLIVYLHLYVFFPVIHNIKCSSCKVTPVRGPRYSCLRCTGYHQCQPCFLFGKTTGKHKLKHPVREYCVKVNR